MRMRVVDRSFRTVARLDVPDASAGDVSRRVRTCNVGELLREKLTIQLPQREVAMYRVLVVDDEEDVLASVRRVLDRYEFDVQCARDADEARESVRIFDPHLILLDILLPGTSGKEFFQELRRTSSVPVIFLSGLDGDVERVVGLELGADDYITKPYYPAELVARARAVLRRAGTLSDVPEPSGRSAVDGSEMVHGPITLDLDSYKCSVGDQPVRLTKKQFGLLKTLMRCPGRTFSRDELMDAVWGVGFRVSKKTINTHIRNLRDKLRDAGIQPIETVRERGYRIDETEDS